MFPKWEEIGQVLTELDGEHIPNSIIIIFVKTLHLCDLLPAPLIMSSGMNRDGF